MWVVCVCVHLRVPMVGSRSLAVEHSGRHPKQAQRKWQRSLWENRYGGLRSLEIPELWWPQASLPLRATVQLPQHLGRSSPHGGWGRGPPERDHAQDALDVLHRNLAPPTMGWPTPSSHHLSPSVAEQIKEQVKQRESVCLQRAPCCQGRRQIKGGLLMIIGTSSD